MLTFIKCFEPYAGTQMGRSATNLGTEVHSDDRLKTLLTVNVEGNVQVEAFAATVDGVDWDDFPSHVANNTPRLVELFERLGAKRTFVVISWVDERYPEIAVNIDRAGHEVACRSYWRRRVNALTRKEFRADTESARSILENIIAKSVNGDRARTFSGIATTLGYGGWRIGWGG